MKILVIDMETTGLDGYPQDLVLEISICSVNTDFKEVTVLYDSILGYNTKDWNYVLKDSWIFSNSTLTLEMIDKAKDHKIIISEVQNIVRDQLVTSFNTDYDFGKFLRLSPWYLRKYYKKLMPCIMLSSTNICGIEGYYGEYKWPSLIEAYEILKIKKIMDKLHLNISFHRSLGDTIISSYILLKLIELGELKLNG